MTKRDTIIGLTLAIGLMLWLTSFATLGVDWFHDGIMLKPALDVLSGQALFKDTFTPYGALTTYLHVLALGVYPSLLAIKITAICAYGVSIYFLYASWRLILPTCLALLSCVAFVLSIPSSDYGIFLPWSSVYAMMFQSVALYALFQTIRGASALRWMFVMGMACAGVFWCRQPVGIILLGCVVVIWIALIATGWSPVGATKAKAATWFAVGFFFVCGSLLLGIVLSGALPMWWEQNFLWPQKWAMNGVGARSWRNYFPLYVHGGKGMVLAALALAMLVPSAARRIWGQPSRRTLLAYYALLIGVIAWQHKAVYDALATKTGGWSFLVPLAVVAQAMLSVGTAFATNREPKPIEYFLVAALAGISIGSLLQYYPVPDPWHIAWSLAPAYGLVIFTLWRCTNWRAPVVATIATIGLLPAIYDDVAAVRRAIVTPTVTLDAPRALRGMRVAPEQARLIRMINDDLERVLAHDKTIPSVLFGRAAILLCFTPNLENPTPYVNTWDGLADDEQERQRSRGIHAMRPLMFIQRPTVYKIDEYLLHAGYVSLAKVPELDLEIAVPREVMDAKGDQAPAR